MRAIVLPRLLYQLSLWPVDTEHMIDLVENMSPAALTHVKVLRVSVTLTPATTEVPANVAMQVQDLLSLFLGGLSKLQLLEWHVYFGDECCQSEGLKLALASYIFAAFKSALTPLYHGHGTLATKVRLWFSRSTDFDASSPIWRKLVDFPLACTTSTTYFLIPTLKVSQPSIPTGSNFTEREDTSTHEVTLLMRECPSTYYTSVMHIGTLSRLFICIGDLENSGLSCIAACANSLEQLSIVPTSPWQRVSLTTNNARIDLPMLRILRFKFCSRETCERLMKIMLTPQLRRLVCFLDAPSLPKTFEASSGEDYIERCPSLEIATIVCCYSHGMWSLAIPALERFQVRLSAQSVRLQLEYLEEEHGILEKFIPFGDVAVPSLESTFTDLSLNLSKHAITRANLVYLPNVITMYVNLDDDEVNLCKQLEAILSTFRLPALQCLFLSVSPSHNKNAARVVAKYLDRFPELHEIIYMVMTWGSVQPPIPKDLLALCARLGIKAGYDSDFTHRGRK